MGEEENFRILNNNQEHSITGDMGDGSIYIEALAANPDRQDSLNCNIAIAVVSVFQRGNNDAAGGAANGTRDGKAALQEAKQIGQPIGKAIYFAVDYDAQSKDYTAIDAYLRAAAKELPGYSVGVYGSYAVVEEMEKRGACKHFWQTYA